MTHPLVRAAGMVAAALMLAGPALAQAPASGIPGVVAPGTMPELVQDGFVFTEGPVGTVEGGLLFSDVQANRTYRLDIKGTITVLRENTGGGNGLALARGGDLYTAEGGDKRISKRTPTGEISTMTLGTPIQPLKAPNDLILDAAAGIYFTDPGPRPVVPGRISYVYYLPRLATQPIVIDDQVTRPNGLTITRNGKTLIVDDTIGTTVFAYDVQRDGTVKNKRPFAQIQDIPAGQESGADGMALDRADRVYISTVTGVQVFNATGGYLGTIKFPRQPANLAFSGPNKHTLYVTAREGLYKIVMLSQGPDRFGK
jgi:gluconolactonase